MSFPTHRLLKANMALNSARGKEEPKADKNSLKSTLAPRSKHHSYSEKRRSNYNHHHPKKHEDLFHPRLGRLRRQRPGLQRPGLLLGIGFSPLYFYLKYLLLFKKIFLRPLASPRWTTSPAAAASTTTRTRAAST